MSENQQNEKRVEHRYLTVFPDLTTVENDLIRLLNDFNNTKLKKYGNEKSGILFWLKVLNCLA
jgi:hypothetical protein